MKFNEEYWNMMVDAVSNLLSLDALARRNTSNDKLFKLAAMLPYLAGSSEWKREGMANLILIVSLSIPGLSKQVFSHCSTDDQNIFTRLQIFIHPNGDVDIQKRGIALMSIVMINDYNTDREIDLKAGKYNPILCGTWDYQKTQHELISMVNGIDCVGMDEVFSLNEALARTFWYIF